MRLTPLLIVPVVATALAAPPASAAVTTIESVRYDAGKGVIVIEGAGGLRALTTRLTGPERLVIDFPGSHFARTYQQLGAIPGTGIARVRVGQYQASITRVVFDLAAYSEFKPVTVGAHVFIPVRAGADLSPLVEATPAPSAPAPAVSEAPAAAAPEAAPPTLTGIQYHQGALRFEMSRRAPYWSHVERGNPTLYTVVFPNTRLASGLDGRSQSVNSFGIFRWSARQDGDDVRIEIPMSKAPEFTISAGTGGWTFASDMPARQAARPTAPRAAANHQAVTNSDAPLTLKRVGDQWLLAIRADGRFRYRATRVGDDRIHLDLAGARVALPRDSVYIDSGLIARVRTAPLGTTTRLTIDLDQPVRYSAKQIGNDRTLLLTLSPQNKEQITVDPGHGGTDHGAIGTKGTREKDVTLAIATRLSRIMEANGMSVQMTRMKDLEILLRPRVDMANRNDSDVFISIHANSFGKFQGVNGIETYYFTDDSAPLARTIHRHLVKTLKRPDRGVRKNNFYVVHHTKMPSALIELGYLSNPQEEALLTSPECQEKAAQAIYAGIKEFMAQRKAKP